MAVRDDIVTADAHLVCDSFNRSIVKWLTEWNFPGAAHPTVMREMADAPDLHRTPLSCASPGHTPQRFVEACSRALRAVSLPVQHIARTSTSRNEPNILTLAGPSRGLRVM